MAVNFQGVFFHTKTEAVTGFCFCSKSLALLAVRQYFLFPHHFVHSAFNDIIGFVMRFEHLIGCRADTDERDYWKPVLKPHRHHHIRRDLFT